LNVNADFPRLSSRAPSVPFGTLAAPLRRMSLSKLTDQELLQETNRLVQDERALLSRILQHLREIEKRRLYSALGYPSLFQYAVRHLRYPEDQAYRRLSVMRLIQELPELEEKVNKGVHTLTNLSRARTLFKKIGGSREEKLKTLEKLENKSSREGERVLRAIDPEPLRPDQVRAVTADHVELRFAAKREILEKIESLRGLLAHKHPELSLGELFLLLCDLGLQSLDKTAAPRDSAQQKPSLAATRRQVRLEAENRCESCGSRYALEIDHKVPVATGGSNRRENLRLLCRSCNQRAAISKLGLKKMLPFLEPP
jgi:hypothetical protein